MKVLHVVYDCRPGNFGGGVAKMVFELACAQVRNGVDAEIWTVSDELAGQTQIWNGVSIRYFKPEHSGGFLRISSVVGSRAIVEAIVSGGANRPIIHAHNTFHPLNVEAGKAARKIGAIHYFHPHGALDPMLFPDLSARAVLKKSYIGLLERPTLNAATGVIALTPFERKQLQEIGISAPIHVVPNGIELPPHVDSSARNRFREKYGIPLAAPVLLFLGRITPKKKVHEIMEALALLARQQPSLHLVIVGGKDGEPDYVRTLHRLAEEMGVTDKISWTGHLNEIDKPAAFAAADIFLHASSSEGMAMAILEAMAHGMPVIATRGCYMNAAAAADALVECEQGAVNVSQAIEKLLSDRPRRERLGKAGRDYVARVHNWDAIARSLSAIYGSQSSRATLASFPPAAKKD